MGTFSSWQLVVLIGLGIIYVESFAFPLSEVNALKSFKEAIYDDPLLVLSNWNVLDSEPCGWYGITCSKAKDHVIKLNISKASLKGFISPDLSMISYLEELILHGNLLIGAIPKEMGMLKSLKLLDLGKNQLTGPIPLEIGELLNIKTMNLQSNGLTGRLPSQFGNLKYLEELLIDRNKLQGTVPATNDSDFATNMHGSYTSNGQSAGLCHAYRLKVVDLSYNFFVGSIPKCLERLPRSSFQGNCLQAKDIKQRPSVQCVGVATHAKLHSAFDSKNHLMADIPKHHATTSKHALLLALEIGVGVIVGSLFVVGLFTFLQKYKSKASIVIPWKRSGSQNNYQAVYIDSQMLKDIMKYSIQELELACEDFSNIIESFPDSLIYKGTMKGGVEIAVISVCIDEEHWTGYLELYFQKEVADLARLNHENIGKLLGYCRESSPFTRILIFEYASNGTLHEHLHYGDGCQLSWTRRMKIAIGIAKGLKYLHTEIDPPFTISELNSNSIYLTEDFTPKLVDFESWKTILPRSEKNASSINNQGAICVLPSSMEQRHMDFEGNIYSFGVLLLEIVSGRTTYNKEKGHLVDWAKEYLDAPEVASALVDTELKHFIKEELAVICQVVNRCLHQTPNNRTNMQELCTMLESNIDTTISAELKASSLAWAELSLSPSPSP